MADKPTLVCTVNGELDAQQIKAFLASNGIDCTLLGESLRKTHGLTLDGLGRVEIHAAEEDVAGAKELLEAAESGELSLPEDEDVG